MNLKFIELEFDWPPEISVFDLRNYILSNLLNYGEPLRWAITSLTTFSGKDPQKIFVEAVLIIHEDKKNDIDTD